MADTASKPAAPQPRRPRSSAQKRSDQQGSKTPVSLGEAYTRWPQIKNFHRIQTHADMANFLMDRYENSEHGHEHGPSTSTPTKWRRLNPPALSSIAGSLSTCQPDKNGDDTLSDSEITCLEDSQHEINVQESTQSALGVDVGIEEINDLRNSIADWSQGQIDEVDSAPADSSDEDFLLGICIRMGGALKSPVCIQNLPIINLEEFVTSLMTQTNHRSVFQETEVRVSGCKHEELILLIQNFLKTSKYYVCELLQSLPGKTTPTFPTPLTVQCEEDLIGRRAVIIYEGLLRQLASFLILPVQNCPYKGEVTEMQCQSLPPYRDGY
uniref:Zinc finger protein 692 n=2 Tax=Nothobranchius kuhntae TaxID=321403 RepID=A0A1A8J4D1_NOTKU